MSVTTFSAELCSLGTKVLQRLRLAEGPAFMLLSSEFDVRQLSLQDQTKRTLARWLKEVVGNGYAADPHIVCEQSAILNGRRGFALALSLSKARANPKQPLKQKLPRDVQHALREIQDRIVVKVLGPDGCCQSDQSIWGHRLLIATIVSPRRGKETSPFVERFRYAIRTQCPNHSIREVDIDAGENLKGWHVEGLWGTADGQ